MNQTLLFEDSEGITKPLHIQYEPSKVHFGGEARINGECKIHLIPKSEYVFWRKDIQSNFDTLKAIALKELESRGAKVVHEYEMDITDLREKVKGFLKSKISAGSSDVYELFSEEVKVEMSHSTFDSIRNKNPLDKYILLVDLELSRIYGETYKKF